VSWRTIARPSEPRNPSSVLVNPPTAVVSHRFRRPGVSSGAVPAQLSLLIITVAPKNQQNRSAVLFYYSMLIYSGEHVACFEHSDFFKVNVPATRQCARLRTHTASPGGCEPSALQHRHASPKKKPRYHAWTGSSSTQTTKGLDRPDCPNVQLRAF